MILLTLLFANTLAIKSLFRFGCDGGIDVLAGLLADGSLLSARFNGFQKIMNFIEKEQQTAKGECGCTLTPEQLNDFVRPWNPHFLLNAAKGPTAKTFTGCGLEPLGGKPDSPVIDLGSTCTYETYQTKGACEIQAKRSVGDMTLSLRVEKCDATSFPFLELTCDGADCNVLLSPCTDDSDCRGPGQMSCLQLTDVQTQCAQATCQRHGNVQYKKVAASLCADGAGAAKPPTDGCTLNGVTYGVDFEYYGSKSDPNFTKVPTSRTAITDCMRYVCAKVDSAYEWQESNSDASQCYDAMTVQLPATGDFCRESGERVKNSRWPLSYQNTCNFNDISQTGELHGYGVDVSGIAPFYVGSTRYVSDVNDGFAALFMYDYVDSVKSPNGCMDGPTATQKIKQFFRNMFDTAAKQSPKTLAMSTKVGMCMPGKGYLLTERVPEPQPTFPGVPVRTDDGDSWKSKYDISIDETVGSDPAKFVKNELGWACNFEQPMGSGGGTFKCENDMLKSTATPLSAAEKNDGARQRSARKVVPITTGAKVLAHVTCGGSFVALPNHPVMGIEFASNVLAETFAFLRNTVSEAWKCRAANHGGAPLTTRQFNVRWMSLYNILYFLTTPLASASNLDSLGVGMKDMRSRAPSSTGGERLEMPATCTFDRYIEKGQCALQFTGLSEPQVLDRDTKLNFLATLCPGSFLPEVYLECEGVGCEFFDAPQPCTDTCPGAGKCTNLPELLGKDIGSNTGGGIKPRDFKSGNTFSQTDITGAGPYDFNAYIDEDDKPAPFKITNFDFTDSRISVQLTSKSGQKEIKLFEGSYAVAPTEDQFDVYGDECDRDKRTVKIVATASVGISITVSCSCTTRQRQVKRDVSRLGEFVLSGMQSLANLPFAIVGQLASPSSSLTKRQGVDEPVVTMAESSVSLALPSALIGYYNKCKSETMRKTAGEILARFINLMGQRPDDKSTSFCLMDTEKKDKDGNLELSNWAKNQFSIDGDKIKIKSLLPWKDTQTVIATQDGGASIKGKSWLDNSDPDVKIDIWKDRIQVGTLPSGDGDGNSGVTDPSTKGSGSSSSAATSLLVSALVVIVAALAHF